MDKRFILIFESHCPKCRILSKLIYFFDIKGNFQFLPLRSKKAIKMLKEFFESPPYNFFIVDDEKDLCLFGINAIPAILKVMLLGLFWPFGGKWNYLEVLRGLDQSSYNLSQ